MYLLHLSSDSKVHGAIMGPIWGRQDPGGPHVGPMNIAFWDIYACGRWQYKGLSLKMRYFLEGKIIIKKKTYMINYICKHTQIMA